MTELESFLHMGGYARYVWPAYGLTLLVLGINVILPVLKNRDWLRRLRRRYEQGER